MIFQGKAVLVYLEEDNIARAYFRIQPLLTAEGPVSKEELNNLPDEGYLRIVPDRNEQHTFKERMRTMCGFCMLDLRNQPADANKIRTNKNYNPANGENNQYIVYSDAVCNITPDTFYQVVSQNNVEKAVTPVVYIRNGANMQGPVPKDNPVITDDTKQLAPDSKGIYSISVNGQELLFYCPQHVNNAASPIPVKQEEKKEAQQAEEPDTTANDNQQTTLDQIQQMNAACVAHTANKLNEKPSAPVFVPQQQPLNGTRLYSTSQRNTNMRRAHNSLMETVELQRYASKPEAPGAVVNDSSALKAVQNPVDAFKRCLQKVCINQEDCQQAVDIFLNCPGMRQAVTEAVTHENKDLTVAAMHNQLQELEAERLMLLMQLDDVKKDMSSLKQDALLESTVQEKAAIEALQKKKQALKAEYDAQEKALAVMNRQREENQEILENLANDGRTVLLTRPIGEMTDGNELADRLKKVIKTAGFACDEGDALSLLVAYALSPDALYFSAAGTGDAALAVETFAKVFAAPLSLNKNEMNVLLAPGGNTPAFVRGLPRKNCTAVLLTGDAASGSPLPVDRPFAMLPFYADFNAIPAETESCMPVNAAALKNLLKETKLNEESIQAIQAMRNLKPVAPLPVARAKNALRFIAATQNIFKGGVAEAIDRAVTHFILPHYLLCGMKKDEMAQQLASLPRSLAIWNKAK